MCSSVNRHKLLSKGETFFMLMFFSPLLGVSGFWYPILLVSVVYYLFVSKAKISIFWGGIAALYVAFLVVKYNEFDNFSIWFTTIKFYMGWGIVTLFLYYSKISVNIHKLTFLFCCEVLLEFLLVNTIIPQSALLNYPNLDYEITTGAFKRVYSVGCNATNSSTILVLLLTYRESLRKSGEWYCSKLCDRLISVLSFISIIAFGSGTGFLLFFVYILYKANLLKIKNIVILFSILFGVVTLFSHITIGEESIFQRLSAEYFEYIWMYKEWQITEFVSEYKVNNIFLGSDLKSHDSAVIWGDFAFLEYYVSLGFAGILLFILYLMKFINRLNFFPILIGVVGAFHYGGICTFPGQLILAYSVLLNKSSLFYYTNINQSLLSGKSSGRLL